MARFLLPLLGAHLVGYTSRLFLLRTVAGSHRVLGSYGVFSSLFAWLTVAAGGELQTAALVLINTKTDRVLGIKLAMGLSLAVAAIFLLVGTTPLARVLLTHVYHVSNDAAIDMFSYSLAMLPVIPLQAWTSLHVGLLLRHRFTGAVALAGALEIALQLTTVAVLEFSGMRAHVLIPVSGHLVGAMGRGVVVTVAYRRLVAQSLADQGQTMTTRSFFRLYSPLAVGAILRGKGDPFGLMVVGWYTHSPQLAEAALAVFSVVTVEWNMFYNWLFLLSYLQPVFLRNEVVPEDDAPSDRCENETSSLLHTSASQTATESDTSSSPGSYTNKNPSCSESLQTRNHTPHQAMSGKYNLCQKDVAAFSIVVSILAVVISAPFMVFRGASKLLFRGLIGEEEEMAMASYQPMLLSLGLVPLFTVLAHATGWLLLKRATHLTLPGFVAYLIFKFLSPVWWLRLASGATMGMLSVISGYVARTLITLITIYGYVVLYQRGLRVMRAVMQIGYVPLLSPKVETTTMHTQVNNERQEQTDFNAR